MKSTRIWLAGALILIGSLVVFGVGLPQVANLIAAGMHTLFTSAAALLLIMAIMIIAVMAGAWLAELWRGRRR